ncbi:unnamed protein product, partial [marine sediment metagenome]
IGLYFEENGIATSEELFELDKKEKEDSYTLEGKKFDFLEDKPKNLGLEGYLFPDTYEIFYEEGIEDIVRRMLDNFGRKLTLELEEEITSQGKSIFEIVIMAIGGELHADEEVVLIEQEGSKREYIWGINLYPEKSIEEWIEFDSVINLKPSFDNRSREVDNPEIKKKIKNIVEKLVSE